MTPPLIQSFLLWPRWPVASLRAYFLTLMVVATVPLAILASLLIGEQILNSQNQLEADLARTAESVALTVEREIASSTDALYVLSFSDPLQSDDIPGIFSSLSSLPAARHSWRSVFLVDLKGDVLFNTRQPPGQPLGQVQDMAALKRLERSRRAVVTDLIKGPDGHYVTGILVPVMVQGKVAYALGAWIEPSSWQRLITDKDTSSSTSFITIFDSRKRMIARNMGFEPILSTPLPEPTQAQIELQPREGVGLIGSLEGGSAYGAWKIIEQANWGVVIGEPAALIDQAHRRSIISAVGMGLLSVLAGIFLSMLVARRLTRALRRLAQEGPTPRRMDIGNVKELRQLESALAETQNQREIAREKLQSKADEFQAIFQSSAVGLAITQTPDCISVLHNPALAKMLGENEAAIKVTELSRSAWPQLDIRREGRRVDPEDLPLQRAAQTGQTQRDIELEILQKDGHVLRLVAQAIALFNPHGYTRGAIATFTDITDIKQTEIELIQAERRLRESQHLIELAQAAGHVGFFNHDFVTGRVSWTSGTSRLFGLQPTQFEGSWSSWFRHIHPEDRRAVRNAILHITHTLAERSTLEFRTVLPDRSERWLSSRIQINYAPNRQALQMNGVMVDITQQKSVDQERAALVARETQARKEAEKANSAKDEFLAMLGHELRNPLGAISAGCEVLMRSETHSEMGQRARQIITRQTHHLGRLMDDLLDVARVISGKILLSRQPLRLDELVQRVIHTFELSGQLSGHIVRTELQPVWIHADVTRIEQIITNLLSNALKYTPEGGDILLEVKPRGDEAILVVKDNGIGMTAELQAKAFDLFVQGERSLDRRQGGLGIGLTLVRRLTELHDGRISVESDGPNLGCQFTLNLPLARPDVSDDDQGILAKVSQRKVVVVEDNDDAREALTTMLGLDGHITLAADNGPQGLSLIMSEQPDIALVDIGLPGLNGYEIAHQLRQGGYRGLLVAMSGYGQLDDLEKSRDAGFDDYLVKPVNPEKLQRLLVQASSSRATADQHHQGQQDHGTQH